MPKIDFHILQTTSSQQAWLFTCQLIEKNYTAQQRIYIHTSSKEDAERFDALLWTYKDDSFIPHQLHDPNSLTPVQIGYSPNVPAYPLLINLSKEPPPSYQSSQHLIEIVFSDPTVQQLARERYKQYRDQGYEITTHK
jgi:DNA polymerase-3 subunit chi